MSGQFFAPNGSSTSSSNAHNGGWCQTDLYCWQNAGKTRKKIYPRDAKLRQFHFCLQGGNHSVQLIRDKSCTIFIQVPSEGCGILMVLYLFFKFSDTSERWFHVKTLACVNGTVVCRVSSLPKGFAKVLWSYFLTWHSLTIKIESSQTRWEKSFWLADSQFTRYPGLNETPACEDLTAFT